ncbi:hypothetical protein JCM6882_006420 [Rhodosporidiobolus microsporus]
MTHRTRRYTKPSVKATLSTLSLASFASAFVVTPGRASTRLASSTPVPLAGASSVRKSINVGLTVPSVHHDDHANASPALVGWNANRGGDALVSFSSKCADDLSNSLKCVGKELAKGFVDWLHPDAEFKLVDGYASKHNGLFHAHFVQVVDGLVVSNANLNVNVDLATGKVVSYGDSTFASACKAASESSSGKDWKHRVAGWAETVEQGANQVIFGARPDSGPQGAGQDRAVKEAQAPARKAGDPRHPLLTFMTVSATTKQAAQRLRGQSREQLLSQLWLSPGLDDSHDLLIDGFEDSNGPTKASLQYIHDGEKLTLVWKYEIDTDDNMYEAYMTADASIAPGEEELVTSVDWVRDFRPTGGEIGSEIKAWFGPNRVDEAVPHLQDKPLKRSASKGFMTLADEFAPAASTTDEEEVKRLRKVQPEYKVYKWGVNAPDEGKRLKLKGTLVELDAEASPVGWHTVPGEHGAKTTAYYETRGNNVLAQDNPSGGGSMNGFRANGGPKMEFDFPIHMTKPGIPLDPATYINASVTELFYTNNEIHDLYYRLGFNEESGNFQESNFGRGGLGGDAVQANAQDGSGFNNANFATPPDGGRPRMRMYVWNAQQPYRDGDLEEGIVVHEYSHGLSTRLTGGPANSGCLGWGEAGGMGEGWGDFLATTIRMHDPNITDYDMGAWASNRKNGIRYYRYSRDMKENPSTYKFLDKSGYWGVHAIGEVWAEMLFEMEENLIDAYGFNPSLFPPPVNGTDEKGYYSTRHFAESGKLVPAHGNTLAIQLVVDGMKIQPCRPTFQNARDAILTADKALTGGENACAIWKAFSKRGLGPDSKVVGSTPWGGGIRTEDYEAPKACKKDGKKGKKERTTLNW